MHRFSLVSATLALATFAVAQPIPSAIPLYFAPVDSIQQAYVSNLNIGDSYVNVSNIGVLGAFLGINNSNGDICVNVYVFDPAQEMLACCSCLVTPDGLNSFSVKNDLINKTLTPAVPTSVVIKLTATAKFAAGSNATTTCSNTAATSVDGAIFPGTGPNTLVSGMRATATTLHQNPQGTYSVTENNFWQGTWTQQGGNIGVISQAEMNGLTQMCGFVIAEGSKQFGFCNNACNNNGLSGAKK
jgi:hypothetical protein